MSRLLQWTAVAGFALVATACATSMTVSSHVAPGLDVTPYHTFDWGPKDALPTGDARLDKDPYFQDHVEGAIEKAFAAKGFERTISTWPDLLVHYHANISRRIDVNAIDRSRGYVYGDPGDFVTDYEAGTLVLDVVDARTNKVIWRGWAQDTVEDTLKNQDRMGKKIDEAVRRMFEQFPRSAQPVAIRPAS